MAYEFPVTIYYEDTDMAGIVYYANYLKYIERARSDIVEQIGGSQQDMRDEGIFFAVRRVVADYLGAAKLGDRLTVRTTTKAEGAVRWIFDQEVWRGDQVIFKAEVMVVCITSAGKPTVLPEEIRSKVEN